jgi:hypothetical protein
MMVLRKLCQAAIERSWLRKQLRSDFGILRSGQVDVRQVRHCVARRNIGVLSRSSFTRLTWCKRKLYDFNSGLSVSLILPCHIAVRCLTETASFGSSSPMHSGAHLPIKFFSILDPACGSDVRRT